MPSSPHASVTQPPWSVRIRPEQVSGMVRNGCPESIGTGVRNGPESALADERAPRIKPRSSVFCPTSYLAKLLERARLPH